MTFRGRNIFEENGLATLQFPERENGGVGLDVGIVMFERIGITCGRLDEEARGDHSITAFAKGLWDDDLEDFVEDIPLSGETDGSSDCTPYTATSLVPGLGIVSNTVGDIVEPVTSSTIVRINGFWVQRHTDRCTLNRGNTPGEYIHQNSTETNEAPNGNDSQDKTRTEKSAII